MPQPTDATSRALAALTVVLALGGCATTCPDPPVPAAVTAPTPAKPNPPARDAAIDPAAPRCDLLTDERTSEGTPCRTVGTLVRRNFTSKSNTVIDAWPVLILADGQWLMLESIWLPDTRLDPHTLAALEGHRVEVAGVLHHVPPGSRENWAHMPTLAPLTSIYLAAP